ncbi:mannose-6-phosphate isomerase, partial [Subtercola boreus]
MPTQRTNYDKAPVITVPGTHHSWTGASAWQEIARHAEAQSSLSHRNSTLILVDTYPGVDFPALKASIGRSLPSYEIVDLEELAALPIEQIDALIAGNLTDDRVFGVLSHHNLTQFYDPQRLKRESDRLNTNQQATIVVGWGAGLLAREDATLVLADMARWEIQQRYRRGAPNWRSDNGAEDNLRKVKRGYFVEWRVADRHKRSLFPSIDYVLDTNSSPSDGTLITAEAFRAGMAAAVAAPFRVVPFFDPGVWGGQWMKDVVGLDPAAVNYAWGFDCVPEENSILLQVGTAVVELPAIDVVFTHPRELLGELTFARFGAEFPIRFDFLDTMDGDNLSLQVHPVTDYIRDNFGMQYTQDESYYLLDAEEDAVVYLGLKTGIDPEEMLSALQRGAEGSESVPVEQFVNTFPARKHDHFSIPAGTVHASGAGSMVLEISATPYLFTFKMWDWDRVGLDGVPRPIHLEHAAAN